MQHYFQKITSFDIDAKMLYDEWFNVAEKHNMFKRTNRYKPIIKGYWHRFYYNLIINYPDGYTEDIDPVWITNCTDNQGQVNEGWSIENIIKDFKGSYTEKIAKTVNDYVITRYKSYKPITVKYAVLGPNYSIPPHIDKDVTPRFFLTIHAPKGCYMQMLGEKLTHGMPGHLFRIQQQVEHSPINESDDFRVIMMFDYATKK